MDEAVPAAAADQRAEQIQLRIASIDRRIDQLAARRRALDSTDPDGAATTASVGVAAGSLEEAIINADRARKRLAQAELSSAEAHDRAAALHERLRVAGTGDTAEHERKARAHRAAADFDRRLAAQHGATHAEGT